VSLLTALVAGTLFGAGLWLSGMTDPQVVLGFLDVGGAWNPALAFTMGGALLVAGPAYYFGRQGTNFGGAAPELPPRRGIDARLLAGAGLFGVGWGLAGICPGPALILLTSADPAAYVFGAAMAAGMLLAGVLRPGRG
jgi:uncharacterized protein